MQIPRIWIVIIFVVGAIFSGESKEVDELNAMLEINSDAPEKEMATGHPWRIESGENRLDPHVIGENMELLFLPV